MSCQFGLCVIYVILKAKFLTWCTYKVGVLFPSKTTLALESWCKGRKRQFSQESSESRKDEAMLVIFPSWVYCLEVSSVLQHCVTGRASGL